ncbi:uncharacterized protein LOC111254661 isoform X3 [Varroa destructor]|uniref:RING-type domain-containing protein n=1 Tax=Varroa destructor TaxID=109461 RepID=A0A7M7KVJ8_VARDE|nr:uncharacterized protein LOC111254661 isoform X3 [Varroa destructor]
MALLAERTAIELAGKIRMIATCSTCRNLLQESYVVTSCSHYFCADCARKHKAQCPRCNKPGIIRRAEYLDKVASTLHQIRDILLKEDSQEGKKHSQNLAKKRKQDFVDFSEDERPSPKANKLKSIRAKKSVNSPLVIQNRSDVGGQVIFAKKSTPVTPSTPNMGIVNSVSDVRHRIPDSRTPTGVSGSIVPKKLLKQALLSPVVASQRPQAVDSDDGTATSQDTDFSFSGVVTQVERSVEKPRLEVAHRKQLTVSGAVAVSAIEATDSPVGVAEPHVNASCPIISLADSPCCACQCHRALSPETAMKGKRSSAVQVQNILTLDVSTSMPRVTTKEVSIGTDPLAADSQRVSSTKVLSVEVQTDRPYVAPPKLYREAIVQTDLGFDIGEPSDVDQTLQSESSHKNLSLKFGIKENTAEEITDSQIHGNGNVAVELPPTTTRRHGNRCSTQRATVQATNAQPMSLDMSPIKQKAPPLKHREQPTIAPSEQELSRLTDGRHIERNILDEKDSLDSVDFTSCEQRVKQHKIPGEPVEKAAKVPSDGEKDALESMCRSSEGSIPETLPLIVSPTSISAKKSPAGSIRVTNRTEELASNRMSIEDSQFVLPIKKALDLSDEEADDFMANIDTQMVATKRKKLTPHGDHKSSECSIRSQKGRRRVANLVMSSDEEGSANDDFAVPAEQKAAYEKASTRQSNTVVTRNTADYDDDEEDEPIAPLDTEDMKNLERSSRDQTIRRRRCYAKAYCRLFNILIQSVATCYDGIPIGARMQQLVTSIESLSVLVN